VGVLVMLAALAAVGLAAAVANGGPASPSASCAATTVRYLPAKYPTLGDRPWVLASPGAPGVAAFLPTYTGTLRDARVNRSDGLVLWQTGERIVWNAAGTVVAQRLDGPGSLRLGATSTATFPTPGCWRLTFRTSETEVRIVARVVPRPSRLGCAATPVGDSLTVARPRSAGIAGGWTWRTDDGGALVYTHGIGPGDLYAKVPWWIRGRAGPFLELTAIRLDGQGRLRQELTAGGDPSSRPSGYSTVFPSTVDLPAPGCWLLRLRTGDVAAVLVARAIDR
jgi:hypothetical protein